LGIPGIWWIDLQIDGVKKGSLARLRSSSAAGNGKEGRGEGTGDRIPGPGDIIACSSTSPIDALYLAAIFDPVFTASYPGTKKVHTISLWGACVRALLPPRVEPPRGVREKMVGLEEVMRRHPRSVVVVFPECTTTNGRGILSLSPSLLSAPSSSSSSTTKIFPVNLRYSPPDITTPVPGNLAEARGWWRWRGGWEPWWRFVWCLCAQPTHCIRVRIAEGVRNSSSSEAAAQPAAGKNEKEKEKEREREKDRYLTNFLDTLASDSGGSASASSLSLSPEPAESRRRGRHTVNGSSSSLLGELGKGDGEEALRPEEKRVLDKVAEALARLGRVKRVGLGVADKVRFVDAWEGRGRR
jgi:hypothetical protein